MWAFIEIRSERVRLRIHHRASAPVSAANLSEWSSGRAHPVCGTRSAARMRKSRRPCFCDWAVSRLFATGGMAVGPGGPGTECSSPRRIRMCRGLKDVTPWLPRFRRECPGHTINSDPIGRTFETTARRAEMKEQGQFRILLALGEQCKGGFYLRLDGWTRGPWVGPPSSAISSLWGGCVCPWRFHEALPPCPPASWMRVVPAGGNAPASGMRPSFIVSTAALPCCAHSKPELCAPGTAFRPIWSPTRMTGYERGHGSWQYHRDTEPRSWAKWRAL